MTLRKLRRLSPKANRLRYDSTSDGVELQHNINKIGDTLCLVPNATSFSISGNGNLVFAKKDGNDYDVLFASLYLVHGGIADLGIGRKDGKEALKSINDYCKLSTVPLVSSSIDKLKEYLFGAYAYYLSLDIPEYTKKDNTEMRKALSIVGNDFDNTEYWLGKFTEDGNLIRRELIEFMNSHTDIVFDESGGETAVLVDAKLKISNPEECLDELLDSDDIILSDQTPRRASLAYVKPYTFDSDSPMDKLWMEQQQLIKEGKSIKEINNIMKDKIKAYNKGRESDSSGEEVQARSLMLDGDSAYERLGGIDIWSNGKVKVFAFTISSAGACVERLASSGADSMELLSVEYLHWKDVMKSKEERKKAEEISKLTAEAVELLNKKTPEDDKKGIGLLNKALEVNPNDYDSLYIICDVLLAENHAVEAEPLVERLLKIAPNDAGPHLWKAQILMDSALDSGNRHTLVEAMGEADKALSLDRKSFDSAAMCAQLSYFLGERRYKLYVNEMEAIDKERAKRFMKEYFID